MDIVGGFCVKYGQQGKKSSLWLNSLGNDFLVETHTT